MTTFSYESLLPLLKEPRERLCENVLALCRSEMPAEPQEGWLRWIYDYLTLGLYPDANAAVDPVLAEGADFYVSALEWILERETGEFDPLTDLLEVPEGESRVAEEYSAFQTLIKERHLMALLRIGRACMPFDTASHIIGVHNVALHAGILAQKAGLTVDLPLVSAAALAHDVGKFGCRGEDAKRVPYLHYYYTWTWLEAAGLEEIGQVAANHSTWDLEFENLPMESLLLI